jgi:hypothetical protein
MLIRLIPFFFIFIGAALLFCHPSPFREPEYLQNRNRLIHDYQNRFANQWTKGDFNNDQEEDSAYVTTWSSGSDSGEVVVRLNHLIPSIDLPKAFSKIIHFEKVNDCDGDGSCEIYLVAAQKQNCKATGYLYSFRNHKWKIVYQLEQDGCCAFGPSEYVSVIGKKRFIIKFYEIGNNYEQSYEGVMN